MTTYNIDMQQARDTAADWTSNDPTLAAGVLGWESDTGLFKFGDGSTAWTSLAYYNGMQTYAGDPNGNLTPAYKGQECYDTTNDIVYKAIGITNTSWEAVLHAGSASDLASKSTPVMADIVPTFDSESSNVAVQSTWTQIFAALDVATKTLTPNAQTGTTYTLVLTDAGKKITMSNASANTLTIPLNSSVAFSVGTIIGITMLGAGATTVDGATGVTVNGTSGGGAAISAQYTGVTLTKLATDTWLMEGNHGAVS